LLQGIGSRIIAAIFLPFLATNSFTASISLKGSTRVSFALPSVTPAESGIPKVARPEPAATRRKSQCP
jgi:hypothetical protein